MVSYVYFVINLKKEGRQEVIIKDNTYVNVIQRGYRLFTVNKPDGGKLNTQFTGNKFRLISNQGKESMIYLQTPALSIKDIQVTQSEFSSIFQLESSSVYI